MDTSMDESLTLEGMDFDHSEDVVNQEDITLEDTGRLGAISMDMDDIGQPSHNLMDATNDEVIVSDLIEEPFPFQEYTTQCDTGDGSNIMIDPNKISELDTQHATADSIPNLQAQHVVAVSATNLQALLKAPAAPMSNVVPLKAPPRAAKRIVATAPPRQVAIAPKPVPKTIQYAIAPKPVALVPNKQAVGTMKKIPITTDGKGNTVLAQIGRQLVMVPKKIKLMSSTSSSSASEGLLNTSSTSGLQYQMTMTQDQMQMMNNSKGKPMLKFIQVPAGQSSTDSSSSATLTKLVPANVPRARYVMQQKTVPISALGANKMVQNIKIAGKKQIIAIKPSQSPQVVNASQSQGHVTTKNVVISSKSGQKLMIRSTAPTAMTQAAKDALQRTQIHPINVPGKGIQYIKLVTNQSTQKMVPKVAPSKNFVFTDSQGKVIQMTAEKVTQPTSVLIPGPSNKGHVKTIKCKKKLVRLTPISKTVTQSTSQPARSSQSLLAPITTTPAAMSLPTIETPSESISLDFNEISDDKINNYINKSSYDSNDFSLPNDNDYSVEEFSTANEFDDANLQEETVQEQDPDATIDVKPTLQSLISEAVGDDTGGEDMGSMLEVEIDFEKKRDSIRNASFMFHDESHQTHETSNASAANEESIIIVPGNYADKQNDSLYSDESQSYRQYSEDNKSNIPILAVSVETECLPYPETAEQPEQPPLSPHMSDQEAAATLEMRPRKACNCTKSQCLKLYCDCFANGEFCNSCNCNNCHNNLENEETRQKAIRSCLERNPNAFRPKIGKAKAGGPEIIRRHTKGCNCKRSGCLKNYCECYEAKIACTAMCKCVGCRNVEETLMRRRDVVRMREKLNEVAFKPAPPQQPVKQPCSFMTYEVIEAVCQCMLAAATDGDEARADPVHDVIEEFARCLQDVITASHHTL